jgi:hypothetical protein
MALSNPTLVWVEGYTSPMRLSQLVRLLLGYGLALVQDRAATARALWAGPEAGPPPPPERAARGDDAVTPAPVRARASTGGGGPASGAAHRARAVAAWSCADAKPQPRGRLTSW